MAKIHEAIATVFGLGHLPWAPGTWGSAAGLALCLALHGMPIVYFAVFAVIFAVGIAAADAVRRKDGVKDPSYVVIDEFSCVFLVFAFVPMTVVHVVLGFALFRFFDIVKPEPIRSVERIKGGWGIMLDDAVAAVYANLILQILRITGV